MKNTWVRKLIIWVVFAIATFSYFSEQLILSLVLGVLFVGLLYVDIRSPIVSEEPETAIDLERGYKLEKLRLSPLQMFIVGLIILTSVPLVLKFY